MAASRPTLRALSKLTTTTTTRRTLRMTAAAPSPSPLLTSAPKSVNLAQELEDASKRPSAAAKEESKAQKSSARHFNTSRSLKTVGDSSTIDFAYLPAFEADAGREAETIRVPLLPTLERKVVYAGEVDEVVMRPEISLVAADGTHLATPSALREVHDNNAVDIDFSSMADRVAAAGRKAAAAVGAEQQGLVRQVWEGFVEDLFGGKAVKR